MTRPRPTRTLGRADRVLDGIWRLRLPLHAWPGVPHVNTYALRSDDGLVLVDAGLNEPGALKELERALAQCNFEIEDIQLLVCTHAHSDHYGLAAPITAAADCELWMHPAHGHMTGLNLDPELHLQRRLQFARQFGVPEEPLRQYAKKRKGADLGVAGIVLPNRDLLPGVELHTDQGRWTVHEVPGHAPSHIALFQPELGLLISGDHLLGRVTPYFDYGWTPDPAGEFLNSLDVVEALNAKLCLSGHGKPFRDVQAHIDANRKVIHERIEGVAAALGNKPLTAIEIMPEVFGEPSSVMLAHWWMSETFCYLMHLATEGKARTVDPLEKGKPAYWVAAS